MYRLIHCEKSAAVLAPRYGCICDPCRTVARGIKDDFDVNDLEALLREQNAARPT